MPRSLKLAIIGLVAIGAVALVATSFLFGVHSGIGLPITGGTDRSPAEVSLGLVFWTVVTLAAQALPVRMPRGVLVAVSTAPILASADLGGPAAAGWIALVGTTEIRELRGRVPWYGTIANHAGSVLPAIVAGLVIEIFGRSGSPFVGFLAVALAGVAIFATNTAIVACMVSLRTGKSAIEIARGDSASAATMMLALGPLAWLMARTYDMPEAGWWATLLFALPLYTTRLATHRFVEMREMFTQTISSLAQAVDKRDKFTSGHSLRVKEIAVDIGREMRVSEPELEALEWGGLLHDVGKIGVPDAVLLKQERLNREERMIMNAHPVLGDEIIAPVSKLAAERPIIRHHHEWYNGSGYPDRLIGDEIPKLARILHVADAFEAMTAARPYRMTPLTPEQALNELRKFAGIQFDPTVVDAFVRTKWVENLPDPGREVQLRPIPLLAQAAGRMAQSAQSAVAPTAAPAAAHAGAAPAGRASAAVPSASVAHALEATAPSMPKS